ncbi:MAG: aspartate/glutamate racemase family protein [Ignavibacteriaceae bacterium]|jgi:aspartate racemase|nr:aspartate/glutamate racemase family protein [Ignavibacteriaceae bacterium]MCW9065820.1 aspartate/glutamate racemase family protein [Ignavibacteriaceae bacterium]
MKTIGMIGGTGWPSTLEYYRIINQETNRRLGGLSSAKIMLSSFNYAEIDKLNKVEDHTGVYKLVLDSALKLKAASVDCIILCANTLHQYVEDLEKETNLKIVHIADATAKEINGSGLSKIGLLGTRFTMEMEFYTKRLMHTGIESLVPPKPEREFIHNAIMNELLKEEFKRETKEKFVKIINDLEKQGAQGIVLGCTEIPLLLKQDDIDLPVFNTLEIHAKAAVDCASS